MAKNYFDKNGNYINVENLSLAEIYHRGYQDGAEDGLQDIRPKGEWLHPYITDIACECSNCHMQMPITDYFNFCPNCSADMRKGDKE